MVPHPHPYRPLPGPCLAARQARPCCADRLCPLPHPFPCLPCTDRRASGSCNSGKLRHRGCIGANNLSIKPQALGVVCCRVEGSWAGYAAALHHMLPHAFLACTSAADGPGLTGCSAASMAWMPVACAGSVVHALGWSRHSKGPPPLITRQPNADAGRGMRLRFDLMTQFSCRRRISADNAPPRCSC